MKSAKPKAGGIGSCCRAVSRKLAASSRGHGTLVPGRWQESSERSLNVLPTSGTLTRCFAYIFRHGINKSKILLQSWTSAVLLGFLKFDAPTRIPSTRNPAAGAELADTGQMLHGFPYYPPLYFFPGSPSINLN